MKLQNIPTENLMDGIKKSFNNADALLNEAFILKEHNKYSRAYALCQFAVEELAKIPLLIQLWIDRINGKDIDYHFLNHQFKSHPEKIKISQNFEIAIFTAYKEQSGADWVDRAIKKGEEFLAKVKDINNLKNDSLYVSINENFFQAPEEIIDEEKLKKIYGAALMRRFMFEMMTKATEKDIHELAQQLKSKSF